jgi:hypothetical protein
MEYLKDMWELELEAEQRKIRKGQRNALLTLALAVPLQLTVLGLAIKYLTPLFCNMLGNSSYPPVCLQLKNNALS